MPKISSEQFVRPRILALSKTTSLIIYDPSLQKSRGVTFNNKTRVIDSGSFVAVRNFERCAETLQDVLFRLQDQYHLVNFSVETLQIMKRF